MNRTAIALTVSALLFGATACSTSNDVSPAPVTSSPTAEETDAALTPLQKHIKEDAIKEVTEEAFSKQGVIDYLTQEYPFEDVKAGVAAMACEADWMGEAAEKAATYGVEDKAEIKSRLLDDGFTEEEAEFGANPVPQS